jgi:hypothetical protein
MTPDSGPSDAPLNTSVVGEVNPAAQPSSGYDPSSAPAASGIGAPGAIPPAQGQLADADCTGGLLRFDGENLNRTAVACEGDTADDPVAATQGASPDDVSAGDPEPILFGQARISPEYSSKPTAPDYLRDRNIYEVAQDLSDGNLSPNEFFVVAFRHQESGQLVTNNNRSLAVLSLAGLRPTNLLVLNTQEQIDEAIRNGTADPDLLDRLQEETPLQDTLPSVRIAVTPSQYDWTIDYSDPTRPGVIYIPGEGP